MWSDAGMSLRTTAGPAAFLSVCLPVEATQAGLVLLVHRDRGKKTEGDADGSAEKGKESDQAREWSRLTLR